MGQLSLLGADPEPIHCDVKPSDVESAAASVPVQTPPVMTVACQPQLSAPQPEPHRTIIRRLVREAGKRDPRAVAKFAAECAERATKKAQGKDDKPRHAGSARAAAAQCAEWIDDIARKPEGALEGKTAARCAVDAAVSAADHEMFVWDAREAQLEALGGAP